MSTAAYSLTGDPYVDGVLSGIKWGESTLTFSFPSDASFYGSSYGSEPTNNFEAFTAVQQAAVREILKGYAAVINVDFVEVTETAAVHGTLRYAESDAPSTAWAYYPSTSQKGGDAWFNNSKNYYDNPAVGNYAWLIMIHETGHAMGLKHPHEARGSFPVMPADRDSHEYTVMSYKSYAGSTATTLTNGSTSYPQTLMMYDIAALQAMYGANYKTNAGDTVYRWDPSTGQMSIDGIAQLKPAGNKIFMTLWDGGGNDTYDFSNYTGALKVDLAPGGWTTTSATQLASLGSGKVAVGNIANALLYKGNAASLIENAVGGAGNDAIFGNSADNRLTGGRGNDVLDGRGGVNTAVYSGNSADYGWTENADGSWSIADLRSGGPDGIDTLWRIDFLKFADAILQIGSGTTLPSEPTEPPPVVNTAPVAANDAYAMAKGGTLTIPANGILSNDSDAEGDALRAVLVTKSPQGSLTLNPDGSFTYTPPKSFTGSATFTYKANDGALDSNLATVTVTVAGGTAGGKGKGKGAGAFDRHDQVPAPSWTIDDVVTAKGKGGGKGQADSGGGKGGSPDKLVADIFGDKGIFKLFAPYHDDFHL